jgi:hypothetical protein
MCPPSGPSTVPFDSPLHKLIALAASTFTSTQMCECGCTGAAGQKRNCSWLRTIQRIYTRMTKRRHLIWDHRHRARTIHCRSPSVGRRLKPCFTARAFACRRSRCRGHIYPRKGSLTFQILALHGNRGISIYLGGFRAALPWVHDTSLVTTTLHYRHGHNPTTLQAQGL